MRMSENIIVVAPTTAVPINIGFAVALKVFPAPSFSSSISLPFSNSGAKPNSRSISALDAGQLLDHRKLEDRLRVVRHGPVAIHGDGHRAHAQHAEGDEPEGEHRRIMS